MAQHYFSFSTVNGHFVIGDSFAASGEPSTSKTVAERLRVAPGRVDVRTVEGTTQVALTIDTLAREPETISERWACALDCSLKVESGTLVVLADSKRVRTARGVVELPLAPGEYRLRVACDRGHDVPVVAGGAETYHVALWPAAG